MIDEALHQMNRVSRANRSFIYILKWHYSLILPSLFFFSGSTK